MSDTSAARVGGASALPFSRTIEETPGSMFADGTPVEPMDKQTSKAWYGVAIAVGIVAVLGGVFGGLGLLQAHYHFLPGSFDWLAKAVECVGNLGPHNAVLWALAGAGLAGVGAIAGGSYKVHQARKAEQAEGSDIEGPLGEQVKDLAGEQRLLEEQQVLAQYFEELLGDNFVKLGINDQRQYFQESLLESSYNKRYFSEWVEEGDQRRYIPEACADKHFVVIKDSNGLLKCSETMIYEQREALVDYLNSSGYQYMDLR